MESKTALTRRRSLGFLAQEFRWKLAFWLGRLSWKIHPGPIKEERAIQSLRPSGRSAECTCPPPDKAVAMTGFWNPKTEEFHVGYCPVNYRERTRNGGIGLAQ